MDKQTSVSNGANNGKGAKIAFIACIVVIVVLNKMDDSKVTLTLGNTYTLVEKTLGIKGAIVGTYPGATITVTFSDAHVETLTIE